MWSTNLLFTSIFKDFTNQRKKNNRAVVLVVNPSPTFLNIETTNETFEQSRKKDSFRYILDRLANMYESWGWQFFKTTIRM